MYQGIKQNNCNFDQQRSVLVTDNVFWTSKANFQPKEKLNLLIKKGDKMKEKIIQIGKEFIKYSKNKYISLSQSFLTILRNQNDEIVGVQLQKESNKIELYGQITKWISILMKECITLDFVSNFQIVKLLGSGSGANVYQVRSKIDNQFYAIKVFDKLQIEKDYTLKQSIRMEVKYLKKLNHPHIIKYEGVFESNNQILLLTELLEGGDLGTLTENQKISENQVKQIMKPLLSALVHMHNKEIFHRDIKKCNIMLKNKDDWDSVCLIDFGLAESVNDENDYLFKYCGTPGCVAPEILRKQKYGLKVDVYSVGILCYQLLTGKDPYQSPTTKETIMKNFLGKINFKDITSISSEGYNFLKELLEIDASLRLTAKQALLHPFLSNEETQRSKNYIRLPRELPKLNINININSRDASPNSKGQSPFNLYYKRNFTPRIKTENCEKQQSVEKYGLQNQSFLIRKSYQKMNSK